MAIAHLSVRTGNRAGGDSAAGLGDYERREGRFADRADDLVHTESGNMPSWARADSGVYWRAADEFERKNGRLYREVEFSLPRELNREQQVALGVEFAKHLADEHDLPWTMGIHDTGNGNPHVHVMLSERVNDGIDRPPEQWFRRFNRKTPERGGARKTQELTRREWLVRVRDDWEQHANAALERAERAERISMKSYAAQEIGLTPGIHLGKAGHMTARGIETERAQEQAERVAEQQRQIDVRPETILERLSHAQAVFTRWDIARELGRHVDEPEAFGNLMARIEASPELVLLQGRPGERGARYSTRGMIEAEAMMAGHADAMTERRTHALPRREAALQHGSGRTQVLAAIRDGGQLSDEQQAALSHVLGPEQIAVIAGVAGAGKSLTLGAARAAWEADGYRVIGAALAGKAADGLQAGSGIKSGTLASLEYRLAKGKETLGKGDVLVIDEAGMVGSRQMARVLEAARKGGAKVVLVGDAEQLQPIEAGAAFRAIAERVGFAEIGTVRRQRDDWAREASQAFARGNTQDGLAAYERRGGVWEEETRDEARRAIAADYLAEDRPEASQIILAHSNRDVEALNQAVRDARIRRGELGAETAFEAERGARRFAGGDRIVFLKNDRELGVKNGTLGTVLHGADGRLTVALDGPKRREIAFSAERYGHVDHGYAVTLHKAQGVTVDRALLLATPGMDRHLAYVGMTRHRQEARLYYGQDDFAERGDLYRVLGRKRLAGTTLDFAERRGIETRRGWLEAGRDALGNLGRRLEAAFARVRELIAERDRRRAEIAAKVAGERERGRDGRRDANGLADKVARARQERQAAQEAREPPSRSAGTGTGPSPAPRPGQVPEIGREGQAVEQLEARLEAFDQEHGPTITAFKRRIAAEEQRIGSKAERLKPKAVAVAEAVRKRLVEHVRAKPAPPSGLAGLVPGAKGRHEAALAAWERERKAISARLGRTEARVKAISAFLWRGGAAEAKARSIVERADPALAKQVREIGARRQDIAHELSGARTQRQVAIERERGNDLGMDR